MVPSDVLVVFVYGIVLVSVLSVFCVLSAEVWARRQEGRTKRGVQFHGPRNPSNVAGDFGFGPLVPLLSI